MKQTLELLEKAAWNIQQHRRRFDPGMRKLEEERETLFQNFCRQHRHNKPLIQQVIRLPDASGDLEDACTRLQFHIGLQMGLEPGAPDAPQTD